MNNNNGIFFELGVVVTQEKTCLLVDDIEAVRDTTSMILESFGYNVVTASNGRKAMSIIKERGDGFDLIVTDILMPESDGLELGNELEQMRSSGQHVPPVIGCSGGGAYVNVALYETMAEMLFDVFIEKPFTVAELRSAIETATERCNAAKKAAD